MKVPKSYLIVDSTDAGPALHATVVESSPTTIPTPTFRPGRSPLIVEPEPLLGPPWPPHSKHPILFVPIIALGGFAFWCVGKIRFAPIRPDGRRPHQFPSLAVYYDKPRLEPPQPDEIERLIELLHGKIPLCQAQAFGLQAAILRAAARKYFAGS